MHNTFERGNEGYGMRVVGFCGLIGSGKTTAAQHLVNKFGYERVRFAGPLKDMSRALLSERQIDGDLKEVPCDVLGGKTPRVFMQLLGTEFGRQMIDQNIWVNAWLERARKFDAVVADDVRFPNEADAIHKLGGTLILIERPGAVKQGHASEGQALDHDGIIPNDGSIERFLGRIAGYLQLPK